MAIHRRGANRASLRTSLPDIKYIATDNGEIGYKAYTSAGQKDGNMLEIVPVPTHWEALKTAVLEDAAKRRGFNSAATQLKKEREEQAMIDHLPEINKHLFS